MGLGKLKHFRDENGEHAQQESGGFTMGFQPVVNHYNELLEKYDDMRAVVKYTMEWLNEVGCIHVGDYGTRQACVADMIDDRQGALLDVVCEMALNGRLSKDFTENIHGFESDINIREIFSKQIKMALSNNKKDDK